MNAWSERAIKDVNLEALAQAIRGMVINYN